MSKFSIHPVPTHASFVQTGSLACLLPFLSGKLLSHCILLVYSAVIVPIQLSLWYKVTTRACCSAQPAEKRLQRCCGGVMAKG